MMSRDNLELVILAGLSLLCIIGVIVLTAMEVPLPDLFIGIVGLIIGATVKEVGETGQIAKSERVLRGQELVEAPQAYSATG